MGLLPKPGPSGLAHSISISKLEEGDWAPNWSPKKFHCCQEPCLKAVSGGARLGDGSGRMDRMSGAPAAHLFGAGLERGIQIRPKMGQIWPTSNI